MKTGSKDDQRDEKRPSTRTEAAVGREASHLSKEEQHAMELKEELQHSHGQQREQMTKRAKKLGDEAKE